MNITFYEIAFYFFMLLTGGMKNGSNMEEKCNCTMMDGNLFLRSAVTGEK
jgi:hypothetical protein